MAPFFASFLGAAAKERQGCTTAGKRVEDEDGRTERERVRGNGEREEDRDSQERREERERGDVEAAIADWQNVRLDKWMWDMFGRLQKGSAESMMSCRLAVRLVPGSTEQQLGVVCKERLL